MLLLLKDANILKNQLNSSSKGSSSLIKLANGFCVIIDFSVNGLISIHSSSKCWNCAFLFLINIIAAITATKTAPQAAHPIPIYIPGEIE